MDADSIFVPVSIVAVAITLVNLLKYARAKDWNAVLTYVAVFLILAFVLWLYGNSVYANGQVLPGSNLPLGDLGIADIAIAALAFTGPAVVTWDAFGAVDNSRSTIKPPLVSPKGDTPPPP